MPIRDIMHDRRNRMKKLLVLVLFLCMAAGAGCYSSTSLKGDGADDGQADPVPDVHHDYPYDGGPELPPDMIWDMPIDVPPDVPPDIPPDILVDVPLTCPEPMGVWVSWTIDGTDWPWSPIDIEQRCNVEYVRNDDSGASTIGLLCMASAGTLESHTIEINSTPPIRLFLWEGVDVIFRYVADTPFLVNRWFSLREDDGGPIVTGVDADGLLPPAADPDLIYTPLLISSVGNLCPRESWVCFEKERLALDVSCHDMSILVYDQSEAMLSCELFYHILVENAERRHNISCTDTPSEWYRFLIAGTPGE